MSACAECQILSQGVYQLTHYLAIEGIGGVVAPQLVIPTRHRFGRSMSVGDTASDLRFKPLPPVATATVVEPQLVSIAMFVPCLSG